MKRSTTILLIVVLLVGGGVGAWAAFFRTSGPTVRTATVERRPELSATIRASGKLDVSGRLAVQLPQAGTVRLVAVKVGDVVKAGDVLAALDDGRARTTVKAAQDTLDAAQYALTNARQRTGNDADRFAAVVDAESKVRDAQRQLDAARDALARTLVTAPTDGTVLSVAVVEKTGYNQGQEVAQIANLNNLILIADLDELDVPRLGDNRDARVVLDAFPGQEIKGTLTTVAPVATNRGGRTIYEGTITFARPPGLDLRPGMGADVTVATRTERNVLVVPDLAIETIGAKTFITVLHDDRTQERVEVRTGIRANGVVVLASGATEGLKVLLP